ncbi:MAG: hypothetical protein AAFO81_05075 [Pseudomonadota bacterium]
MIFANIDHPEPANARLRALTAALTAILINPASASAGDIGVVLQSASDTIYHGTPETRGDPSFAASVTWQPHKRFFAGTSGRLSPVSSERQRHSSIDVFVGTAWSIGDDWLSTLSVQRREFPGAPKAWQYTEYKVELTRFDGWRASLDFALDYYAHNTRAAIVELEKTTFWSDHWYWQVQAGAAELSATRLDDYHYARISSGYTAGRVTAELSYGWNSEDGTIIFGPGQLRSQDTVLSIAYRLF